ncbi:MAG: hypothetical protein WAM97_20140 [Acidimicrobiales bacterium]
MLRRIMLGVLAVALPVGLLTVVIAPNLAAAASIGKTGTGTGTGTGTYNCSDITGTITFSPPLTATSKGTATETETYNFSSSGCTGGSPAVVSSTGLSKKTRTSKGLGNCSSLSNDKAPAPKFTTEYSNGASNSTIKGGAGGATAPNGNAEFVQKNATVTGSYPSATADTTAVLTETDAQIGAQCESAGGLSTLTISSGHSKNI